MCATPASPFSSFPVTRRSRRNPGVRTFFRATGFSLLLVGIACAQSGGRSAEIGSEIVLAGGWSAGLERSAVKAVAVPDLVGDPTEILLGTLWYRRSVQLPEGDWNLATLRLGGARFAPTVYIDGEKIASSEGGMAPVELPLRSRRVAPGRTVLLEVALQSLRDLAPGDASAVPMADRWRSNVSSGLWDNVTLHFSREVRVARLVPWTDFAGDKVAVHWTSEDAAAAGMRTVQAFIADESGRVMALSESVSAADKSGVVEINLRHECQPWTPETPRVYHLRLVLSDGVRELDRREIPWGLRDFRTEALHFSLNGKPVQLRGGTVVWHRWLRDPEARALAWDTAWFERTIVQRLKDEGANFLRFHLGLPPEALLDLCDRSGLMVQIEWPFFHGVKATQASMSAQWRTWLDVAMRHPCAVLIHPWNETEGDELKTAWTALNSVLPEYPPLVIAHRDALPVHKYWWSLFENLGLYYDSAAQFGRPAMVDEFGGNYTDSKGDPGAYPTVRETFLRFLGRESTRERRLQFQAESNARVAEYWRRLGVAGIAPFCAMSSPQDGNTWFLGPLAQPTPKPVWAALTAAFSPESVSLEIWDRNFAPGQRTVVPLNFFNDRNEARELHASVRVVANDATARVISAQAFTQSVPAHDARVIQVTVDLPREVGEWRLEAELTDHVAGVKQPIISAWQVRTLGVETPAALREVAIAIDGDEPELAALLAQNQVRATKLDDPGARALVLSRAGWQRATRSLDFRKSLEAAMRRGQSVVLLDIGPGDLGAGYKPFDPDQLEGAPRVAKPRVETRDLFAGITMTFREAAEPESHLHPALADDSLWRGLPAESTWLWNGLRGGLIVPAEEMDVNGLAPSTLAALWVGRGANEAGLRGGPYYAYQLADYYAFSVKPDDKAVIARLQARVKQMVEDAPSLQVRINPNAAVEMIDLAKIFGSGRSQGEATALVPLASAGKNLARTPIVELQFSPGSGTVILSQVLTAGRLQRGHAEPGLYGLRYDPAAEQFVLNLIARAVAR